MIQFNGTNIKDIVHNGAYIQTVMQNGNTLYQRTKPLADGAYIQTVNGDTFTEAEYTDLFSSLKTITKSGITVYALPNFDSSMITALDSDYDTAIYVSIKFNTTENRNKYTVREVIRLSSTSEILAIKDTDAAHSGDLNIKYHYNDSGTGGTSGRVSYYTIIPKDKNVNGFLFKKGDHKVLCASAFVGSFVWGYNGYLPGVSALSLEEAVQDFNGVQNTKTMVISDSVGGSAMQCTKYQFPSGKSGYLPACGELNVMGNYITEYRSLYNLINGTTTGGRFIFSSTQSISNSFAAFGLVVGRANEGISTASKTTSNAVLPFQVIE